MHPTVLHEDSTLVSGDFPAAARRHLRSALQVESCVMLHCMGAAGNQSPRHVVKEHSFAETERLGSILGRALETAIAGISYTSDWKLRVAQDSLDLPIRNVGSVEQAENLLQQKKQRLDALRATKARPAEVRTAECDYFGATETLALARARASGLLDTVAAGCLPAELFSIGIAHWTFIGWPAEVFVEYALELHEVDPNAFLITLANGEMQGYFVTAEAVCNNTYEASNALFASPESPQIMLAKTLALLVDMNARARPTDE